MKKVNVKKTATGVVTRTLAANAALLVASGEYTYTTKQYLKKFLNRHRRQITNLRTINSRSRDQALEDLSFQENKKHVVYIKHKDRVLPPEKNILGQTLPESRRKQLPESLTGVSDDLNVFPTYQRLVVLQQD